MKLRHIHFVVLIVLTGISINALTALGERKVSEESLIFQELKNGVFTIMGDEGQGSGFLIDRSGVILTNQHVIANSVRIRAQIDDTTVVACKLLLSDDRKDLAVLLVNPAKVVNLPQLKIRHDLEDFAIEGERVIAIGSPLHQDRILTSGIISKLEKDAIISDVNINHGNSGGPLINMDKEVIGINTFGDFARGGGPGIAGTVRIDVAYEMIDSALLLADAVPLPETINYPSMPNSVSYVKSGGPTISSSSVVVIPL